MLDVEVAISEAFGLGCAVPCAGDAWASDHSSSVLDRYGERRRKAAEIEPLGASGAGIAVDFVVNGVYDHLPTPVQFGRVDFLGANTEFAGAEHDLVIADLARLAGTRVDTVEVGPATAAGGGKDLAKVGNACACGRIAAVVADQVLLHHRDLVDRCVEFFVGRNVLEDFAAFVADVLGAFGKEDVDLLVGEAAVGVDASEYVDVAGGVPAVVIVVIVQGLEAEDDARSDDSSAKNSGDGIKPFPAAARRSRRRCGCSGGDHWRRWRWRRINRGDHRGSRRRRLVLHCLCAFAFKLGAQGILAHGPDLADGFVGSGFHEHNVCRVRESDPVGPLPLACPLQGLVEVDVLGLGQENDVFEVRERDLGDAGIRLVRWGRVGHRIVLCSICGCARRRSLFPGWRFAFRRIGGNLRYLVAGTTGRFLGTRARVCQVVLRVQSEKGLPAELPEVLHAAYFRKLQKIIHVQFVVGFFRKENFLSCIRPTNEG